MTSDLVTGGEWTNWVGNQSFTPDRIVEVNSEADVPREVAKASDLSDDLRPGKPD